MLTRASRCGVGLFAAVAMLVSATGAQAAPLYAASQVLASTSNGINLAPSMQMYGGKIADLATAQTIALSHTSISLRPAQLNGYGAAMKAANPNLRIFLYLNGMYAQKNRRERRSPAAWYMHAPTAARSGRPAMATI